MKKVVSQLLTLTTLVLLNSAYSEIPNSGHPTTNLGPTLRAGYTSSLTDTMAYSLAGEAGFKNFRASGTLGWKMCEGQRLKFSGEFLDQDLTYSFFSGDTDEWVYQGALGGRYEYEIPGYTFYPLFTLSGYASYAPNKSLDTVTGTFIDRFGATQIFTDYRRIAGSVGLGLNPGFSFQPWQGGTIELVMNYDNVRYDKHTQPGENAIGLGGTINFNQTFTDALSMNLSAADRQPFNNYAATFAWSNLANNGNWIIGLFGGYTTGKNTLPSSYNYGISADYLLDCRNIPMSAVNYDEKAERDFKGEATVPTAVEAPRLNDGLLQWTAIPAVYMPQVLAVADEEVTLSCAAGSPRTVATIPNITTPIGFPTAIPTAPAFLPASGLTFAIASITKANPADTSTATINPITGVVTVSPALVVPDTMTITVTAANACGIASTSFSVLLGAIG